MVAVAEYVGDEIKSGTIWMVLENDDLESWKARFQELGAITPVEGIPDEPNLHLFRFIPDNGEPTRIFAVDVAPSLQTA